MPDRHVGALIVGGGAAAAACAESLHEGGFGEGVLLVGREPDPPYERPPCSKEYLAGKQDRDACLLHDADWYSRNGIELATRTSVMKLDMAARTATLSTKEVVEFGVALLATGANVRRLRVDGAQLSGIHYLRTLGTSDAIRADADQAERVVLIGGSYIACEVAATLTARGQHCTLVMLEDAPLSTTFGPAAGAFFADVLRSHGVELVTGDGLERLEGAERVERVVTASGLQLPADMVVMGTGAMPDVLLARAAGLALGESGGVACAAHLETSAPGVFAAGDMCEWDSGLHEGPARIEHFEVAQAQGRAAAAGMLGSRKPFAEVPYFWTDLADWASAEWVGLGVPSEREVVRGDPGAGAFSVLHVAGGRVIGALSVERGADLESARRLIAEKTDVGEAPLADADLEAL
jgi:3-phenylpropionate/trans-cinnamate dioxygenase ferredoxin reductase subunit